MTTRFLILLIAVYATFSQLDAAGNKALFYVPTLSFSHVAFNIRLAELLAKNGYEVVIISFELKNCCVQTLLVIDIDPNVQYGKTDKSKVSECLCNLILDLFLVNSCTGCIGEG
jgi:hypothetical protein